MSRNWPRRESLCWVLLSLGGDEARDLQSESGGGDTWPWDVFLWSLITSLNQCCISTKPSLPYFFSSLISPGKNSRKRRLMELRVNSLFFSTWYSKTETGEVGFVSQARILVKTAFGWVILLLWWHFRGLTSNTFFHPHSSRGLLCLVGDSITIMVTTSSLLLWILCPSLLPWEGVWVPWVLMVVFIFFNHISIKTEVILHVSWPLQDLVHYSARNGCSIPPPLFAKLITRSWKSFHLKEVFIL